MKPLVRLLSCLCTLLLTCLLGWLLFPARVEAASPIITVAHWDSGYQCSGNYYPGRVDSIYGSWDADSFTRDTLAGEVYSSWTNETLKANAVLIRAGAIYFALNPESNDSQICNTSGTTFHVRSSRYQGWARDKGALLGNENNHPNDRVTDMGGRTLRQNGQVFYPPFNDCLQNYTQELGLQGRDYNYILTSAYGIYGSLRPSSAGCSMPNYSSLTVYQHYSFRNSMTNGTAPTQVGTYGYRSDTVTAVFAERQAEEYYGHAHMDDTRNQPFGQPGIYATGYNGGDKIEYLMNFGDTYRNLHLIGIADKPGPVKLNIYVDGYYRSQVSWTNNDNARHLVIATINGIPYTGSHAIAVEFANDVYVPGGTIDQDRTMYLDVIGVTN